MSVKIVVQFVCPNSYNHSSLYGICMLTLVILFKNLLLWNQTWKWHKVRTNNNIWPFHVCYLPSRPCSKWRHIGSCGFNFLDQLKAMARPLPLCWLPKQEGCYGRKTTKRRESDIGLSWSLIFYIDHYSLIIFFAPISRAAQLFGSWGS